MSDGAARALAARLLADEFPRRWRHVQAVANEAARLCDATLLAHEPVVPAAWLHDIGYAPAVAKTGFHPLDGARYLRALGWDDTVCRLVAHHTSASLHASTRGLAEQLRHEFAEMAGLAQDVLWTADATTGPSGERFTLDERIAEVRDRYGPDHPVARRMTASRSLLEAAIERVADACR